MKSLLSRVAKLETGIDVARLSDDQLRRLDAKRLSLAQIQALDVAKLTDEQALALDVSILTDEQLDALQDRCGPEAIALIKSMSDEELRALAEMRLCVWLPGYRPDLSA